MNYARLREDDQLLQTADAAIVSWTLQLGRSARVGSL